MDYGRVAELPVTIESHELTVNVRETPRGFERVTTTVSLSGEGVIGRGEDVTYDAEDHRALAAGTPFDLAGEYTIDSFSETLDAMDLFPSGPQRPPSRRYRRWAFESAALDLALRQTGRSLGDVLDRSYDSVEFVVSTRLGEPPSFDRVDTLLDSYPDVELKLDPTTEWSDDLIDALARSDAVRILDMKGQYAHADVHQPPSAPLYERLLASFPDALLEDPAVSPETRSFLEANTDRIAWDIPAVDVESLSALPFDPAWVNVKPSRIGTIGELFNVVSYCLDNDIRMYGGGQFELDVGSSQVQELASLWYPDAPNDVAPPAFDDDDPNLPERPLDPPGRSVGFGAE